MNLRPLIIDTKTKQRIADILSYAEDHPYTSDDIPLITSGAKPPAGDQEEFTIEIPYGYHCVFTYELQPAGKCRHLSITINSPDLMPAVEATQQIMDLFGFYTKLFEPTPNYNIWIEDLGVRKSAVNIIELVVETLSDTK